MSAAVPMGEIFARRDHGPWRFLHRLNPLALLAAVLPAMIALVVIRELSAPLAFMVLALACIALGAHVSPRWRALVFVGPPALSVIIATSFGLWIDPSLVADTPVLLRVGDWEYRLGAWLAGLGTGIRFGAILALALVPGLAASGPDTVRAMVQVLRVPYRIGYTALATFRFVPRFASDLATIRAAHRVRGMAGGRGPLAGLRRWLGYIVPLLAGALRHAERVALAMESRAFGAYPTRTERIRVPWRRRDWVAIAVAWALTAAVLGTAQQLLGLPVPTIDKWS